MQVGDEVIKFSTPPLVRVRHFAREVKAAAPATGSEFRMQWKKIGLAAFAGIFLGFSVPVAMSKSEPVPQPQLARDASPLIAGNVLASTPDETAEIQRLKVRNQRLEALVAVLRHQLDGE